MISEIRIKEATIQDVQELVHKEVAYAVQPLIQEIRRLRDLQASMRDVITHKEAPLFFGGPDEVKPETVIGYIKYQGLPAFKQGRLWYIQLSDLMEWQIGRIGYPKRDVIEVVEPTRREVKMRKLSTAASF